MRLLFHGLLAVVISVAVLLMAFSPHPSLAGPQAAALEESPTPEESSTPKESPTPEESSTPEESPTPEERPSLPGEITNVKELVEAVEGAVKGVVDYSLIGYIKLPKGMSVIDYSCVRDPGSIRTEVLAGSGTGTTVLYLPEVKKNSVKAKSGSFRVWRSIERLKLQNTPAVESLLDMIIKMMKDPKSVTEFKGEVELVASLGEEINIALNPSGPIASPEIGKSPTPSPTVEPTGEASEIPAPSPTEEPAESPSPSLTEEPADGPTAPPVEEPEVEESPSPTRSTDDKKEDRKDKKDKKEDKWLQPQTIEKKCYLVDIEGDEFTDTVAIDAETFWLVYVKRTKEEGLVFEAILTDIKTNTEPKMDF